MFSHIKFVWAALIITSIAGGCTYYLVQKGQDFLYNVDTQYAVQASTLSSKEIQAQLWEKFSYQNNPISPKCLSDLLASNTKSISLSKCSLYDQSQEVINGNITDTTFVYNFPKGGMGNIRYTPIDQRGDTFFLLYIVNGGGTGYFSTIMSIDKKGDTLENPKIVSTGGDRCNGGVNTVPVVAGSNTFVYSINLTPADIVVLFGKNTSIKPYIDLEASASSCFAKTYYKYNITKKTTTPEYVLFDAEPVVDQIGWTDTYTYQSCFNTIYNSYVNRGEINLDQENAHKFYDDFVGQCVK